MFSGQPHGTDVVAERSCNGIEAGFGGKLQRGGVGSVRLCGLHVLRVVGRRYIKQTLPVHLARVEKQEKLADDFWKFFLHYTVLVLV